MKFQIIINGQSFDLSHTDMPETITRLLKKRALRERREADEYRQQSHKEPWVRGCEGRATLCEKTAAAIDAALDEPVVHYTNRDEARQMGITSL